VRGYAEYSPTVTRFAAAASRQLSAIDDQEMSLEDTERLPSVFGTEAGDPMEVAGRFESIMSDTVIGYDVSMHSARGGSAETDQDEAYSESMSLRD
jgi:hypothetical protein